MKLTAITSTLLCLLVPSVWAGSKESDSSEDFFRNFYISEMMKETARDRQYLSEPFAVLDTVRLSEITDRYARCPEVEEFAGIVTQVSNLRHNLSIYGEACALLSPDGPGFSATTAGQIDSLFAAVIAPVSDGQQDELDQLKGIVEIYPKAVRVFAARITDLRRQLDREGCSESADYARSIQDDTLPGYLEENQNSLKNEYNYRISKVPTLKALYDRWFEKLKINFLDPEVIEIEEKILSTDPADN